MRQLLDHRYPNRPGCPLEAVRRTKDALQRALAALGDYGLDDAVTTVDGGDLFGQSRWGYYWGVAYMFEDLDDDGRGSDSKQEHINGEGGLRWTSQKNFSILFGYRYKEYSGGGTAGLTFDGPVANLAYTWR